MEVHQRPAYSDHPVDYFVPDFGLSHEIRYTDNNIKNAESQFNRTLSVSFDQTKNKENPRDYVVPDFGVDQDIIDAQADIGWAQTDLGHTWTPTQDKNGYWNVPEAAAADSYSYNAKSGFTDHFAGSVFGN